MKDFMKHLEKKDPLRMHTINFRPMSVTNYPNMLEGREIALNKTTDLTNVAKNLRQITVEDQRQPLIATSENDKSKLDAQSRPEIGGFSEDRMQTEHINSFSPKS